MTVATPPRTSAPPNPDELAALIEEARRRARRRRLRYAASALGAAAVALVLFGPGRGGGGAARPAVPHEPTRTPAPPEPTPVGPRPNGRLTVIAGGGISTIDRHGALLPFLPCRAARGCFDLESVAWSPDGLRLAFSVTTVGAVSAYSGIHVYDPATKTDRQISARNGFSLAWSPSGSHLAYVQSSTFPRPWGTIYVVDADGSHRREVDTGTDMFDMSPSWSPDGKRLVFATAEVNLDSATMRDAMVSVAAADGTGRTVLARHAWAPAWSPDGRRIAYHAGCGGVMLVTPTGADVTAASRALSCRSIGPRDGVPAWSPDGRKLAIASKLGVYVLDPAQPRSGAWLLTSLVTNENVRGVFGSAVPSWRPQPARVVAPAGG